MPGNSEDVLGGAATGAAVGSVAGPWGAALGGLAGGVGGYLFGGGGGDKEIDPRNAQFEDRQYLRNLYQEGVDYSLYNRNRPPRADRVLLGQAAQVDPTQQEQFRTQQMQQANRLAQIAQGQQKGAGELAAQRQAARAVAQQQAMARMGRGNPGAARAAARNTADLGAQASGQAQLAALADQQAANNQLGQLLASGRQADIGIAGQNAQMAQQQNQAQGQLAQQRNLANMDMQLRAQGMNDQTRLAYLGALAQMNQAEMAGRLGQEQVMMQQPGMWGPLMQMGGTALQAYAMRNAGGGGG